MIDAPKCSKWLLHDLHVHYIVMNKRDLLWCSAWRTYEERHVCLSNCITESNMTVINNSRRQVCQG